MGELEHREGEPHHQVAILKQLPRTDTTYTTTTTDAVACAINANVIVEATIAAIGATRRSRWRSVWHDRQAEGGGKNVENPVVTGRLNPGLPVWSEAS